MAAICRDQYSRAGTHLFLAFELSSSNWKLGFTIGFGQRPRERNIRAGDLDALEREIGQAKERFGLPEDAPVLSCTVLRQHRLRSGERRLPWTVRPGQAGCTAIWRASACATWSSTPPASRLIAGGGEPRRTAWM